MFEALFSAESLIMIGIIVGAVFLLYALIKYKQNAILLTILAVAWLGVGCYSGLTCYKYYSTTGGAVGEVVVHDPYEDFNFYEYDLDKIVWYQTEEGTYKFDITYDTALRFEGSEKKYQLLVNNTPCSTTSSTNGRLYGLFKKQFKNLDGEVTDTFDIEINFSFLSSKIMLTLKTVATPENIGILREYVNVNGFKLRIIETIYVSV